MPNVTDSWAHSSGPSHTDSSKDRIAERADEAVRGGPRPAVAPPCDSRGEERVEGEITAIRENKMIVEIPPRNCPIAVEMAAHHFGLAGDLPHHGMLTLHHLLIVGADTFRSLRDLPVLPGHDDVGVKMPEQGIDV